jgi:hypothetical protein
MNRIEVNVITGEQTVIPLTPEEIAALPPAPPPLPRRIAKADIWRRCTNSEAEAVDSLLNAQPIRLQRMWADAQYLSTADELFPAVQTALSQAFGSERASQLLASTEAAP